MRSAAAAWQSASVSSSNSISFTTRTEVEWQLRGRRNSSGCSCNASAEPAALCQLFQHILRTFACYALRHPHAHAHKPTNHTHAHTHTLARASPLARSQMPKAKNQQNLMTLMRTFKCSPGNDIQQSRPRLPPLLPLPSSPCIAGRQHSTVASALNLNAKAPQPFTIFVAFLCVLQFCFTSSAPASTHCSPCLSFLYLFLSPSRSVSVGKVHRSQLCICLT